MEAAASLPLNGPAACACRWRSGGSSVLPRHANARRQPTGRAQRRQVHWSAAAASSAAALPAPGSTSALAGASPAAAAELVHRLRSGQVPQLVQYDSMVEVDVAGTAQHLGLEMEWRLSFCSDGSFLEELACHQMSAACGYASTAKQAQMAASSSSIASSIASSSGGSSSSDSIASSSGGSSSSDSIASSSSSSAMSSSDDSTASSGGVERHCRAQGVSWGSDDAGCPRRLQLDDEEALLLPMWVRTGLWLLPPVAAQLEVVPAQPLAPAAAAAEEDDWAALAGTASPCSSGGATAWLELRLRDGGQVSALVEVCTASWRPLRMRVQLAGEHELWRFGDWREWQPGLWLVGAAEQSTSGESSVLNAYQALSVEVQRQPAAAAAQAGAAGGGGSSRYAQPPTPLLPGDAQFVAGQPEEVPAWHTTSGHSLVRPLLNGCDVGYFILDTGASGFVLDPVAADSLGLEGFGELQVTSMVGRIASRFRRAGTFQLGPLRMERPLFMELSCSGLVSGVPSGGRVVGIVGYDVLRRAVVTMPPPPRRRPPPPAAAVDSPAAAVAATVSAAQLLRGALQYTLRFQHPAVAGCSAFAAEGAAGTSPLGASSSSLAIQGLASSSAAAAAAAVGFGDGAAASPAASSIDASSSRNGSTASTPSTATLPGSSAAGRTPAAQQLQQSGQQARQQQQQQQSEEQSEEGLEWLPLVMLSSLPHVELELVATSGQRHRGLFMMDSGAGGLDLILNSRAARSMRLDEEAAGPGGSTQIKGIGGSDGDNRIAAQRCQLAEVRLGSRSFQAVHALYHQGSSSSGGGSGGLELSQHTSGIVCGGLLNHCALTYDYARMRVGVHCAAEQ